MSLYSCFNITNEGLKALLASMPKLPNLNLGDCKQLNNARVDFNKVNNFTNIIWNRDEECRGCSRIVLNSMLQRHTYLRCSVCSDSRLCTNCHVATSKKYKNRSPNFTYEYLRQHNRHVQRCMSFCDGFITILRQRRERGNVYDLSSTSILFYYLHPSHLHTRS